MSKILRYLIFVICIVFMYDVRGNMIGSALFMAGALISLAFRFGFTLPPARRLITALLITLLFALKMKFLPVFIENPEAGSFWITMANCMCVIVIVDLMYKRHKKWDWFFHFCVLTLMISVLQLSSYFTLSPASLIFVIMVLGLMLFDMFSYQAQKYSPAYIPFLPCLLIITVVFSAAYLISGLYNKPLTGLNKNHNTQYLLPYAPAYGAQIGLSQKTSFSGQLDMKSPVVSINRSKPVLYIFSAENPRYMRRGVFTLYDKASWHNKCEYLLVGSDRSLNDTAGLYTYGLADFQTPFTAKMEIWAADEYRRNIFLPYYAERIALPAKYIMKNELNMIEVPVETGVYFVEFSENPGPRKLESHIKKECLSVNQPMKNELTDLADSLFNGLGDFQKKKDSLLNFFRSNYEYSQKANIPADSDILLNFLFEEKKGHCQLYATAGALLLRLAGIPARYAEGFLVTDYDSTNRCWFARQSNAHAWIEAWDENSQSWVVIDPTVVEGSQGKEKSGIIGDFFQRYSFMIKRHFLHTKQNRFTEKIGGFIKFDKNRGFVTAILLIAAFPAILAAGIVLIIGYLRQKHKARNSGDAHIADLHKLLRKMDKKMKSAGIVRDKTETIEDFIAAADQLKGPEANRQKIRRWYGLYSTFRYQGNSDYRRIIHLRELLKTINFIVL